MRVHAADAESVTIVFTNAELHLLSNTMTEVCIVVEELEDDDEFVRRMGAPRAQAESLMSGIQGAMCDEWEPTEGAGDPVTPDHSTP